MRIACLVLAAGMARRFTRPKQLEPIEGTAMLSHTLATLSPLFGDDLFCAVGAWKDQTLPLVQPIAQPIEVKGWMYGMGRSLAEGIDSIQNNGAYDAVCVALGDQIALTTSDYKRLLSDFTGSQIHAAYYKNKPRVPVVFPAAFFPALVQLNDDKGARDLLDQQSEGMIRRITMENAALDIDTPDDLAQFLKVSG